MEANNQEVFKIIDNFPWNKVRGQVGFCDDVPESLRKIIDENDEIRNEGYWQLDNHLVVQGDLYEGAFYVIPFLLELLRIGGKFEAEEIYDLIGQIYNGCDGGNSISFNKVDSGFVYFIPSDDSSKAFSLSEQCRKVIFSGFEIFLKEIEHNNQNSRIDALNLVYSFVDHKDYVVKSLRTICDGLKNSELALLIEKGISENLM